MADAAQYARLMEPVARRLLGTPRTTHRGGMEWRYGNHESFKVEIDTGLWHDYDSDEKGGTLDLVKFKLGLPDRASAAQWLEAQGYLPRTERRSEPETVYPYRDTDGTLLFEVVRRYINGERRFSQRAPDPDYAGEWCSPKNIKGGVKKAVPYRLPELLQAITEGKTIFFVEGEKDADRLWSLGLPATTNAEGANNHKWLPELAPFFADADVVIIPDYDLKGQQHGERIAKLINSTAKRVRLLDLSTIWPDIKIKNDVSVWLDNGGTAEILQAHVEKLPIWAPQKRAKVIDFPAGARLPWFDQLRRSERGRIITDLRNVMIALRADGSLAACFAFNEMLQAPVLIERPPLAPGGTEGAPVPRQVTEDDISNVQEWLQHHGLQSVGVNIVGQAIEHRAFERRFHPLRDWLDGLEPDGEPDILNSWLPSFFGCPNDEYHQRIGRMFLIAMCARVYRPGCQSDYMLVLEGPQGEVKSQACRALAGEEYFSDNLPEIDGDAVRLSMHLRGKWLIEISELSSFSKADAALLKSFITRQVEQFIPKFGRMERKEPRQCLFVGTTNKDDYLRDETGGRRFWPAKCGEIKKEELRDAREQLFAHAVDRYNHDEQWWPDRQFEKEIITPQQEARLAVDEWLPEITDFLTRSVLKELTLIDVANNALQLEKARLGTIEQRRLTTIMRLCGWKRIHTERGNVWRPSDA